MPEPENQAKIKKGKEYAFFSFFLAFSFIAGVALYALVNYYFIDPNQVFDMQGQRKAMFDAKTSAIRDFDFGLFDGDEYNSLRSGVRHSFDRSSLPVGNKAPFVEKSK